MDDFTQFHFIHIPKCGGTSFREYLNSASIAGGIQLYNIYLPGFNAVKTASNYNQLNIIQKYLFRRKPYKVIGMHASMNVFKTKTSLSDKPFSYTILREPVTRFLSHYYHFYFHQGAGGCKGIHLADLEPNKRHNLISHLSNLMIKYLISADLKSEIVAVDLENAKAQLAKLALFGILERMDESMICLRKKAPNWLSFAPQISRRNEKRVSFAIDDLVSEAIIDEIRFHNILDSEFYSYALIQFDEQLKY